jgi:hypothetical protein
MWLINISVIFLMLQAISLLCGNFRALVAILWNFYQSLASNGESPNIRYYCHNANWPLQNTAEALPLSSHSQYCVSGWSHLLAMKTKTIGYNQEWLPLVGHTFSW